MASAMDISMGIWWPKVAGPGATIEMKVQFLRPVAEGTVTVVGSFTRRGRSLSFMESRLLWRGRKACRACHGDVEDARLNPDGDPDDR